MGGDRSVAVKTELVKLVKGGRRVRWPGVRSIGFWFEWAREGGG